MESNRLCNKCSRGRSVPFIFPGVRDRKSGHLIYFLGYEMMAMGDEIARGLELQGEIRKAGANFLRTEIEASLTFAQAALSAGTDLAKRERDRANARKGYDTLLRFRRQFPVPSSGEQDFNEKLLHLKSVLEALGETGL